MSVVRGFGLNGKSTYTNVVKPMEVWCNFIVDATNGNGLGIRSLKSNGYVEAVFMHTSATPGSVNGFLNPNPAAGFAEIIFKNNFNYYLGGFAGQITPTATSTKIDNSALTVGNVYVITIVGDSTTALWQSVGLPPGLIPTVGLSFVATAVGSTGEANTSTSRVQIPASPVSPLVSVVGDPNQSIANSSVASNAGARILVQFSAPVVTMNSFTPAGTVAAPVLTMNSYTPAGTNNGASPPIFSGTPATLTGTNSAPAFSGTPATLTGVMSYAATAPSNNTVIGLNFQFDGSSVTIDGI